MTQKYSIGDLAKEFNLTYRSLRFYEQLGILTPERDGTVRIYDEAQRAKVEIIAAGRDFDLSLASIRTALAQPEQSARWKELYKLACAKTDERAQLKAKYDQAFGVIVARVHAEVTADAVSSTIG